MKKLITMFILSMILMMPIVAASNARIAARTEWSDLKAESMRLQKIHREAKAIHQEDKSAANEQAIVDTGKDSLNAALNEAEAWLKLKDIEVEENRRIPDSLRNEIQADVQTNLDKIDALRVEVDASETRLELGIVFLKMIGKYLELSTDVSRNTGKAWAYTTEVHANKIEGFEVKLRIAAEKIDDNTEILSILEDVRRDLADARIHIESAEEYYNQVYVNSDPLVNFGRGNQDLRSARGILINAHRGLRSAFNKILAA